MNIVATVQLACVLVATLPLSAVHAQTNTISYVLPRPSRVSMLITDAGGKVVRELLHAAPRPQGTNAETWDGLDEQRQPAPAGAYTWKLLATQGLRAEYLLTLGTSPTPPWDTWPGNHGGVSSLATDAGGVYIGGGCGECTPLLVKQTLDGTKRLWTIPQWLEPWRSFASIASDDGTVYLLQDDCTRIYRFDAGTGQPRGEPWQTPSNQCTGRLSVRAGQIVMSSPTGVVWLDPKNGEAIDQAVLPRVSDVKIDASGRVLVIAAGAVCSLSRMAKTPEVVISSSKLESPYRLAVDFSNGNILVAENSHPIADNSSPPRPLPDAGGNQVKRFSAKGRLLKAYGARGGRPKEGRYNPGAGFLGIYDLAADDQGGFIVTEPVTAPRRIAHFSARGKVVREWYGGQQYANFAEADPEDPRWVWLDSYWGELIQAKVDYAKKTWTVHATYRFGLIADGLIGNTYHGGGRWHVRHRAGQTYLVREGTPCVVRVDEANRRLVPLVSSMLNIRHYWKEIPATLKKLIGTDDPAGTDVNAYLWMDRNGDAVPQVDEMNFSAFPNWWSSGWMPGEGFDYYGSGAKGVCRLPVRSWSAAGVPQYAAWEELESLGLEPLPPLAPANQGPTAWLGWGSDGSVYEAVHTDSAKAFGVGDWAVRIGGNRVFKWDRGGKLQWMVGRHSATAGAAPGECRFFWRVLGSIQNCVVVSDADQSLVHVWDADGLWVGRLLEDPDLNAAPAAAYALCGEHFGGSIHEDPKTGDVLFFGGGNNNTPVYRITGWDQFERQRGEISIGLP